MPLCKQSMPAFKNITCLQCCAFVLSLGILTTASTAAAKDSTFSSNIANNSQTSHPPATTVSSVTMPLHEVLELYRQHDQAEKVEEQHPPVNAVVQRIKIAGRILDQAVTAIISISLEVLSDTQWIVIPLLEIGEHTVLDELPMIHGAVLAVTNGQLQLITKNKQHFEFEVGVSSVAQLQNGERSASIGFAGATLAQCQLSYDASIFQLLSTIKDHHGEVVTLHARNNRCDFKWQQREEYIAPETVTAKTVEAESVIPTAHASLVSTLEGEQILRIAYALRFAGRKSIEFEMPDGYALVRAYLNGQPIATSTQRGKLTLEVFAARAGQIGGKLELVLAAKDRDYLLSGTLPLVLPRASWRTNELHFSTHLPAAFDYRWTNGTLSPAKTSPTTQYVYDIPAPGKALHFHQFLVHRSTPSLTLEYAVSLEGKYFRAPQQ